MNGDLVFEAGTWEKVCTGSKAFGGSKERWLTARATVYPISYFSICLLEYVHISHLSIESDPMKNKDAHDEWGLPTHTGGHLEF